MSPTEVDLTGTLAVAASANSLVRAVLQAIPPTLKNATNSSKPSAAQNDSSFTDRPSLDPGDHIAPKGDPIPTTAVEKERRAYETVIYVLQEFGSRICAAGLVDEHALSRTLTTAVKDIKANPKDADRVRPLFESLVPKSSGSVLLKNIFASIYFIGTLTAELTSSLPNYRKSCTPIGLQLIAQLLRAAIREDAYIENLSANLDACQILADTASLLRPTDPTCSIFPGFPSFSQSRYSRRWGPCSLFTLHSLCEYFDYSQFPQPVQLAQYEVGAIKNWRFLTSDINPDSHIFPVTRIDLDIGETFGRVVHWLVCAAHRIPPGHAVIAYHDQHVELIKWIGLRMGYTILTVADLDISGPHVRLGTKTKAVLDSWLILMASEKSRGMRQFATIEKVAEGEKFKMDTPKLIKNQNLPPSQDINHKPDIHPERLPPLHLPVSISNECLSLSLPPYSAATASTTTNNDSPSLSMHEKRKIPIHRKAPPPPKKLITAKASCGFETQADYHEVAHNGKDYKIQ